MPFCERMSCGHGGVTAHLLVILAQRIADLLAEDRLERRLVHADDLHVGALSRRDGGLETDPARADDDEVFLLALAVAERRVDRFGVLDRAENEDVLEVDAVERQLLGRAARRADQALVGCGVSEGAYADVLSELPSDSLTDLALGSIFSTARPVRTSIPRSAKKLASRSWTFSGSSMSALDSFVRSMGKYASDETIVCAGKPRRIRRSAARSRRRSRFRAAPA